MVLRHLAQVHGSAVLWIDTTGDFNVERIPVLLQACEGEVGLKPPAIIFAPVYSNFVLQFATSALERLQIALAFDIEGVHEVLEEMRSSLAVRP